jgi:hypothetical protein
MYRPRPGSRRTTLSHSQNSARPSQAARFPDGHAPKQEQGAERERLIQSQYRRAQKDLGKVAVQIARDPFPFKGRPVGLIAYRLSRSDIAAQVSGATDTQARQQALPLWEPAANQNVFKG